MEKFEFDNQISSQAEAVGDILRNPDLVSGVLDPERPIIFTGIGTSLHACHIAAKWLYELSEGSILPQVVESHELALLKKFRSADQVVVVSHRGTKRFPNEVLKKANKANAVTVAITGRGQHEPTANFVIRTCEQDKASTHTVSYLSALAVLSLLVSDLTGEKSHIFQQELRKVPELISDTLKLHISQTIVESLMTKEPIFITGFGYDAITADEAALKIKEGTYIWAEGMSIEFSLHGTPAVYAPRTAAILISPSIDDGGRTNDLVLLLKKLNVQTFSCGSQDEADLKLPLSHNLVRPFITIIPFQRLVSGIAMKVGSNPDKTHTETEPWQSAISNVSL